MASKGKELKVKYFDDNITPLEIIENGNWVDLRVRTVEVMNSKRDWISLTMGLDNKYYIKPQQSIRVKFGIAVELPTNTEAIISARSSLFPKKGLLLSNGIGVIDTSYNGDADEWMGVFVTSCFTTLSFNERICQFRIQNRMPKITFTTVDSLDNPDRGGYGSTGEK